jgi:hypothetical protein
MIEGLVTLIMGVASYWIIADFPVEAKFLTPLERQIVISRLREDGQSSSHDEIFDWGAILASLKDWKTYTGMMCEAGIAGPLYGFALFLPTIINGLGFSPVVSQLLTVPPYLAAVVAVYPFHFCLT